MEVKSARTTLGLDQTARAVDNSGSDSEKRQMEVKASQAEGKKEETAEEAVKVFISAAGMRKSMHMENENESSDLMTEAEINEMMKKVEGLSSQVINGHFSIDARLAFQKEIKELTTQINQLNGDGISFSKADNIQLSQKISDLTTKMNEAAVYHRPANAYFFVKSQKNTARSIRSSLDIAI